MHPIIFEWRFIKVSSYGLMLGIAFFVGIFLARRRGEREGVKPQQIENLALWIITSGILGSRFLYTFVEHADYYWRNPLEFFYFQKGGMSFFGGLFFAIAAVWVYCRRSRISFWKMTDIFAPTVALGLAISKIGCFFAGCCHGAVCSLPWAVTFNHPDTLAHPPGVPMHPAQLYESLMTVGLYFFLIYFRPFRRFHGEIFLLFLILYGVARSVLEIFRGSPGHLGTLTTAQFLSIPMVGLSLVWFILRWKKIRASNQNSNPTPA